MSSASDQLTLTNFQGLGFFGDETTSAASNVENDVSPQPSQSAQKATTVTIDEIPLISIDKLYASQLQNPMQGNVKTLAHEVKVAKHLYVAMTGLSITLSLALVLVAIKKYWLIFFLIPQFLGFLEMIITVMIDKYTHGHR